MYGRRGGIGLLCLLLGFLAPSALGSPCPGVPFPHVCVYLQPADQPGVSEVTVGVGQTADIQLMLDIPASVTMLTIDALINQFDADAVTQSSDFEITCLEGFDPPGTMEFLTWGVLENELPGFAHSDRLHFAADTLDVPLNENSGTAGPITLVLGCIRVRGLQENSVNGGMLRFFSPGGLGGPGGNPPAHLNAPNGAQNINGQYADVSVFHSVGGDSRFANFFGVVYEPLTVNVVPDTVQPGPACCTVLAVGACCLPDDSCTEFSQAACDAAGGEYMGDETMCTPEICTSTTGACCLADGRCRPFEEDECADRGGEYQGDGTDCNQVACPQPPVLGACCAENGTCMLTTAGDCDVLGGAYNGDETICNPNPCVCDELLQVPTIAEAPPEECCDDLGESGKMVFRRDTGTLYLCNGVEWLCLAAQQCPDESLYCGRLISEYDGVFDLRNATTGQTINGTSFNDLILGSEFGDIIKGNAGNDCIYGYGGNDIIKGDSGDDEIYGGGGADVIKGDSGRDIIYGGCGLPAVYDENGDCIDDSGCGDGGDDIKGDSGNDVIYGECGSDSIHGDSNDDFIDGGGGSDPQLVGDAGNDTIRGGPGDDFIDGRSSADVLCGGPGNDTIDGGANGDDIDGGDGSDLCDGAGGNDDCHNCEYSPSCNAQTGNLADCP